MEENENENKEQTVNQETNKEEIKNEFKEETVKTAQEVKETIKNVNIKEDAKATTGFISEMVKRPLVRLKEIAEDKGHKDFQYAIILVLVWTIAVGILHISTYYTFSGFFKYNFFKNVLGIIKTLVAPVLGLVVLSLAVYACNKDNKKSFVTIFTAMTAAKIPTIVVSVLSLLRLISSSISKVLTPISAFCTVISTVFTFFAVKAICGEEDNTKFLKTFILVEAIYYVAYLLISYLEIYI